MNFDKHFLSSLKVAFSATFFLILAHIIFVRIGSVAFASEFPECGNGYSILGMVGNTYTTGHDHLWQDITINTPFKNSTFSGIRCQSPGGSDDDPFLDDPRPQSNQDGQIIRTGVESFGMACWNKPGTWEIQLVYNDNYTCTLGTYTVVPDTPKCEDFKVTISKPNGETREENSEEETSCMEIGDKIVASGKLINSASKTGIGDGIYLSLFLSGEHGWWTGEHSMYNRLTFFPTTENSSFEIDLLSFYGVGVQAGKTYIFSVHFSDIEPPIHESCVKSIFVASQNMCDNYNLTPTSNTDRTTNNSGSRNLCDQVPKTLNNDNNPAYNACNECFEANGVWTALGCIKTTKEGIIGHIVIVALGIAGGIGLLMIIASGAMFALSGNDPKKVTDAKELLSSVIIGLIFIIFSVTILEFIGVGILGIPGFGR
jgi:hypothetical protein